MIVDYHIHALGHRGGGYGEEVLAEYFAEALHRGIDEIGFTEHDEYLEGLHPEVVAATARRYSPIQAKLGLEVSFRPGREREIEEFTRKYDFDYLIGSVHHIGDWMFDHPAYLSGYAGWDISELYRAYFSLVEKMVRSRLFDVVGHLDLIKVFDFRPSGDVTAYAYGVLKAVATSGMVVEVNTAGLYKPCEEIYPAKELLMKCYELDIPVTLGSDAHEPKQVGREFGLAREILYRIGYRRVARFVKRRQFYESF